MKTITIVTPCYNEEENIQNLYQRTQDVFKEYAEKYAYEHLFIDNASTDKTVNILKQIASKNKHIKIIINNRNFGHIRSPHHALLEATGDAVVFIVADLQDPPEIIHEFIKRWEETSCDAVIGVKSKSLESPLMFLVRRLYYYLINKLSETKLQKNFMGFGLYDQKLIKMLRQIEDPYPYFRGLIFEVTDNIEIIEYLQNSRKRGFTKNNFYTLYDIAMLGISSHSKIPLRLATWIGFMCAFISIVIAIVYAIYKILYWDNFTVGIAPLVIGVFFFGAVQLIFIGIIGEYLGAIHTKISNRPLVFEKERINFDS
ncbi:MAG: glycosyltransferase family 2 protein [Halobacteriovoraceae bacterium]|jgi:polyisoprenyl-phosphate glycosyltransferase|nr:glycosyltransferase family 2 protein [Halobacteriovoraceae bacterium]